MIQLVTILIASIVFFGFVGFQRGWNRELIATSGIILVLFALYQFDDVIRGILLENVPSDQVFIIQTILFIAVVYFAYQTRAIVGNDAKDGRRGGSDARDPIQDRVLGAIVGSINGYMIFGSIWYLMDINNYPLSPYVQSPAGGTASADFVRSLPLYLLAGGPAGDGNLLALAVIFLFLIVLIII